MNNVKRLRVTRAGLWLCVLSILGATGCLKVPPAGVSVKAVTADLVFGVPPLPEDVPPPFFDIPPEDETPIASPKPSPSPASSPKPQVDPCPLANERSFPEESAPTDVTALAKDGLYFWRITDGDFPGGKTTGGLFKGVGGVSRVAATYFEFAVGEFTSRGFILTEFAVIQDGGNDDGIFITRITRFRNQNDRTGVQFNPEPPVRILPLPVRAGLTLGDGNVGADPNTLAVLRQSGTVTGRKRVDACGTVIDSWFVDGAQEYTATDGTSYAIDYNYSVATQFGGVVVSEVIARTGAATVRQNLGFIERVGPVPAR